METVEDIERKLDSFDSAERRRALENLWDRALKGEIELAPTTDFVNLHCHTFFSYNTYGYSPTRFAWLAKKSGLAAAGIVDFDVLDGVDEFLSAAKLLELKACAGMESRVFVPEFADRVINSPGEPGIAYHMGLGFPRGMLPPPLKGFQASLFDTAQQRNRDLIARVNRYLTPAEVDYEKDVKPLSPAGNVTERHICVAYARKAERVLKGPGELERFWTEKLGSGASALDLPAGAKTLNAIRAKTMKRGGVGYVQPDGGSFPAMADMNAFILKAGGIPVITWLDGTSEGEKSMEALIDVAARSGAAALNIVPDRNYTPGLKDERLANLQAVVALARSRGLPIIVGTEMNSPGNKFVDAFETAELKPLAPAFLKGAHIAYAHSVLERMLGMGYLSDWAEKHFPDVGAKNAFFEELGGTLRPSREPSLEVLKRDITPRELLSGIRNT